MSSPYPLRVTASLDPALNRWLWLVKWLLALPHYVVLAFLWLCFVALSVVAFFAILFTGRYPRSIFDFNVGVLRWSWRVGYYTYGALGTDQYPPFTLEEVPDYPAHLEISYPAHLSRGLVLVKWWLLAIPHYIVVGIFVGGVYTAERVWSTNQAWASGGGLIGLLVLIAAVILLFTGSYPRPLFDLVLGLNRWVLRVAAYAGLLTDEYPPFRLDMGGDEPGSGQLVVGSAPPPPHGAPSAAGPVPPGTQPTHRPWGAGRVVALIGGVVAVLAAGGLLTAGATVAIVGQTVRDSQGFYMTRDQSFATPGFGIVSETVHLPGSSGSRWVPENLLGDVKLRAHAADGGPLFLGVARSGDVAGFLAGVRHAVVSDVSGAGGTPVYRESTGGRAPAPPGQSRFWIAREQGAGELALTWPAEPGDWTIVVMNADGSAPVAADAAIGATFPVMWRFLLVTLVVGGLLLALGLVLVVGALRAGRSPGPSTATAQNPTRT